MDNSAAIGRASRRKQKAQASGEKMWSGAAGPPNEKRFRSNPNGLAAPSSWHPARCAANPTGLTTVQPQ